MTEWGLVVLGAFLALGGQYVHEGLRDCRRRRVILLALEEELSAAVFRPTKLCTGFSSQTFDALFPDIAALLKPGTARKVIRYYLRMKDVHHQPGGHIPVLQAERDELLSEVRADRRVGWGCLRGIFRAP